MMEKQLQVTAPAKINLTLDITGIRSDGYHELVTVMHQISLADTVTLTRQESGITLNTGHPDLLDDERNLAWQAAELMRQKYGFPGGLAIQIEKRIPIEAGLAGGSTDAAAVITGINRLFGLDLSSETLQARGAELGADVPFCIAGGTALCTGRGDVIRPLSASPHLYMVLVKPDFSLSTAAVYRQFDRLSAFHRPRHELFLPAWGEHRLRDFPAAMGNVLQDASLVLRPEIRQPIDELRKLGAIAAQMSGSGPSVFGIFAGASEARAAAAELAGAYPVCLVTESFDRG